MGDLGKKRFRWLGIPPGSMSSLVGWTAKRFKLRLAEPLPWLFVLAVLVVFLPLRLSPAEGIWPAALSLSSALAQGRASEEIGRAHPTSRRDVDIGDLIAAMEKNDEKLKQEEKRLEIEKKSLEALKRDIEAKIVQLSRVKEEVKGLVEQVKKIRADKIDDLVKLYEGMKPEEAAALIAKIDRKWAILLMQELKQNKASKILALLEPGLAARLSEELLGPSWLRRGIDPKKEIELWKIFEQMKPEEAVLLMERFDDETLAQLLFRMKRGAVSKILPLMKIQRAVRISQLLAEKGEKSAEAVPAKKDR